MFHRFIEFTLKSSDEIQIILFVGIMLIGLYIEKIAASYNFENKWNHSLLNFPFIVTNVPIQFIMGVIFVKTIHFTYVHEFGVIHFFSSIHNHFWVFVIGFSMLDLGEYVYHLIMHKVKRLWMFHIVHHSDNAIDVSTTVREHPGENFIRMSFTLLWVFLSGCPLWVLVIRQIIQVFTTLFAHVNFQLPEKINNIIGFVFITPNLHHIHHHHKQPYTDSNYGDVLSIWDRIFGTFENTPPEKIVFGVDSIEDSDKVQNFKYLIKVPFGKYLKKVENINH